MGNRAVITASKDIDVAKSDDIGIYLHWNGGRDSVEAFLKYCKLKGYRKPEEDCYGWARLCQVIGNFLGGTLSIGLDACKNLDCANGDNGVYIIKDWEIVGRKYAPAIEQDRYSMEDMLESINNAMPEKERFDEEFLKTEEVSPSELRHGDEVYIEDPYERGTYDQKPYKVIGFGTKPVNGKNVAGIPYVDKYDKDNKPETNIGNYVYPDDGSFAPREKFVRRKKKAGTGQEEKA